MNKLFRTRQISKGAMVVALIALVAALGGSAIAGKKKQVTTKQIANGAVVGKKLGKGAVASQLKVSIANGPKLVVPAGQSQSATISCPKGAVAIGGAAEIVDPTNASEGGTMVSSFRSGNAANWTVRVAANGGFSRSWLTSAVCLTIG